MEALYNQGSCQVLSQSVNLFDVLVNEGDEDAALYRCLYCQY